MDVELQLLYKNLLVHHLERQEIEYELQVRAVQFDKTDSRSALQRRLRDRLKEERDQAKVDCDILRCKRSVDEEIKIIDENLESIRNYLEGKVRFEGIRDSLKTRIVHYFTRARRVQEIADLDDDLTDLDKILNTTRDLMNNYFSPFSPMQTIREEIVQQITHTLSNLSVSSSNSKKRKEKPNSLSSSQHNSGESGENTHIDDQNRSSASKRRKLKSVRERNNNSRLPALGWYPYAFPPYSFGLTPQISGANDNVERVIRKISLESKKGPKPIPQLETSETATEEEADEPFPLDNRRFSNSHSDTRRRSQPRRRPVSEWNLKYDGKDNGQGLMRFIKEVEFYAKSEQISDRELFRSAIYLFRDQAKTWYMTAMENEDFTNWKELIKELKREFLRPDHDHFNETRAISRKQGPKERFIDYLAEMHKIFNALTKPISESKKYEIVYRNLRADYQGHAVASNIDNLADLKALGRKLDATYWYKYANNANENNPPRNRFQVNEVQSGSRSIRSPPEDRSKTYKSRNFYRSKVDRSDDDRTRNTRDTSSAQNETKNRDDNSKGVKIMLDEYTPPREGVCFNCRLKGHHESECERPKHKFCHKCGFHNVETNHCPWCAKNAQGTA